jgi:lipid-binding SYLF domain-containing protein
MRTLVVTVSLFSLASGLLLADTATDERLANAAKAFNEIMAVPDKGIPESVLNKAECVVVVSGMKKGGVIVGGSFGRGTELPHQGQVRVGVRRRGSNSAERVGFELESNAVQHRPHTHDVRHLLALRSGAPH